MSTQLAAAEKRASTAEGKADRLETRIAGLEKDLAESECARDAVLLREAKLKEMSTVLHGRLAAEQNARHADQEAALARESALREELEGLRKNASTTENAWQVERLQSRQQSSKLEEVVAESKKRELAANEAMQILRVEMDTRASAAQKATVELEDRLTKNEHARAGKQRAVSTFVTKNLAEISERLVSIETDRHAAEVEATQRVSLSEAKAREAAEDMAAAESSWAQQLEQLSARLTTLSDEATECKRRQVAVEQTMASQQVAAEEKTASMETRISGLEEDLAETQRARDAASSCNAQFETVTTELQERLAAEKYARDTDSAAAFTRESALREDVESLREQFSTESGAWQVERIQACKKLADLEEEVAEIKTRDLVVKETMENVRVESNTRVSAAQKAVMELEDSLAKSALTQAADQRAASARLDKMVAAHNARLMSMENARKAAELDSTQRITVSEAKGRQVAENMTAAKKSWAQQQELLSARLATLSDEAAECKRRHIGVEQTLATQEAEAKGRANSLKARIAGLENNLAESEHARDVASSCKAKLHAVTTELHERLASEKNLHDADREAMVARESALRNKVEGLHQRVLKEASARKVERTQLCQQVVVLKEDLAATEARALADQKAMEVMRKEVDTRISAVEKSWAAKLKACLVESGRGQAEKHKDLATRAAGLRKDFAAIKTVLSAKESERLAAVQEASKLRNVLNQLCALEEAESCAQAANRIAAPDSASTSTMEGRYTFQSVATTVGRSTSGPAKMIKEGSRLESTCVETTSCHRNTGVQRSNGGATPARSTTL